MTPIGSRSAVSQRSPKMWGMTDNYFRSNCLSEKRGGVLSFNANNDGIGLSPEGSGAGLITAEIQGLVDAALAEMQAGTLVTCPETCGQAE